MIRRWVLSSVLGGLLATPSVARAEFPTLERAIDAARTQSIVVAEAQAELGVANAQVAGARVSAIGNPYTEIQVDRGWNNPIPGNETGLWQAMSFTYFPLDIGGQRGKRIEEAESLVGWRKAGLTGARANATGAVVSSYGEILVGSARLAQGRLVEQAARDEAKYFQGRYEAKDTTLYEKSVADAEVARWVQTQAEVQLKLTAAQARFAQVTGISVRGEPPTGMAVTPPPLRGRWDDARITEIVDRTPIATRLIAERHYWEASVARYQRERFPPVALEVIAGRGGSAGELRLGAGAVITFPVTRRFQGEIMRAEKGRENAARQLDLYRALIGARLRAARDAITVVETALDELDKSGIPALEAAVAAAVEGFKLGKIDLTRTLLARRDLAIARARRLDLIESAWHAYADLVILSGDMP